MPMGGLFRRRVFRHPFRATTESVGIHTVLFALISGPIHYWRKRARIEAVILGVVSLPPLFYNPASALVNRAALTDAVALVWIGAVVLAPALLAASYRRQGWIEIAGDERPGAPSRGDVEGAAEIGIGGQRARRGTARTAAGAGIGIGARHGLREDEAERQIEGRRRAGDGAVAHGKHSWR